MESSEKWGGVDWGRGGVDLMFDSRGKVLGKCIDLALEEWPSWVRADIGIWGLLA